MDFTGSFGLVIVEVLKIFYYMDSSWLKLGLDGTFELVEVNSDGAGRFRPNGLSLVCNGFDESFVAFSCLAVSS